ncbi:MAG: diguanylate cyclase [Proteobacteria bacterium]|nr:diguanylate cyclase [Pseudomonadota bacterium]
MKKILVVDNDHLILEIMTDILSKEGHQVVTAENGLSALDILKTMIPDVIFVDLVMPDIDGTKLCKIIRGMERLRDFYLVILSATLAEEALNIAELGADTCIAKGPFDQMARNILWVLEQPDLAASRCLSGEMIGSESLYPRRITKELLSIKRHFEIILERISERILETTSDGRILYANPVALSLIPIPEQELLGSHFVELFAGDDRRRVSELMKAKGERPKRITEDSPVELNGYQVALSILPLDVDGFTNVIVIKDITERKRAEETLQASEARLRYLIEKNADGLIIVNREGVVRFANPAAEALFGRRAEELAGESFVFPVADGKCTELNIVRHGGPGAMIVAEMCVAEIGWEGEKAYLASLRDITERKRMEEDLRKANQRMAKMATRDGLTQLYNHRYFMEALEREMARAKRYKTGLALCMMDLDHFKKINDTYGHSAGDMVLSTIGGMLKGWARRNDTPCRYGGEEFAVLLPDTSLEGAGVVSERLREMVARHCFQYEASQFQITISIGIARYGGSTDQSDMKLINMADEALYRAKRKGRNRVCGF